MRSMLETIRRPEYTGDNRCWACTAVNGLLLAWVCVAVALRSLPAATVLAVGGGATITLRGYLVPYTPQFAPRLVTHLPGDFFEKGSQAPSTPGTLSESDAGDVDGEAVLGALLAAGVLLEEDETLFLDESFRERWREERATLRAYDRDEFADAALSAAPAAAEVDVLDVENRTWYVVSDGRESVAGESWLSPAVAIGEVAAVRALSAAAPDLPPATRAAAAGPLGAFLERCPACDGPVEETTATTGCCGGGLNPRSPPTREVLACADCGEELYELDG